MHQAACIREALQQRHRVHSHLARGVYWAHDVTHPECLVSSDLCLVAHLDEESGLQHLVIRELRFQLVLYRWPLPTGLRLANDIRDWRWGGAVLACAYTVSKPSQGAGVLLVNSMTGSCTPVGLPHHAVGSVFLSRWSRTGLLLARHSAPEKASWFSAVSVQGQVVSSVSSPHLHCSFPLSCFSPGEDTAVLMQASSIWLWEVRGDAQLRHSALKGGLDAQQVHWSWGGRLYVKNEYQWLVWASPQDQQVIDTPVRMESMAWGREDRVVMQVASTGGLCFVQSSANSSLTPVPPASLNEGSHPRVLLSEASPDGSAVCVGGPPNAFHIMRVDGSLLHTVSVGFRPC